MAKHSDDNDVIFEARGLKINAVRDDGSELPIVKGVDFKVRRGDVVALIGESGQARPPSRCRHSAIASRG